MKFGEAGAPVSLFVQKVGPVFLSGTSNMLILLGRGLEVSLFSSEKNCVVLVSVRIAPIILPRHA